VSKGSGEEKGQTVRAGVIGWPIEHSRSPMIHGYWLNQYGIEGSYTKEAVPPEQFTAFVKSFASRGFAGANVTIPHKQAAFAAADDVEPAAAAVGAANTLWLEGSRLRATNSDTYGFMTHLSESAPGWQRRDRPVVILGAGGAARAIAYGFLEAGVGRVRIVNRTLARAEALARHFGPGVSTHGWSECERLLMEAGVLVNTTSLGMTGNPPLELSLAPLAADAVVADIVYVPLETQLLARARAHGLATVDGLGMLLHQAVPGFEKWFGRRPAVTPELRALIEKDL
jgi:shikimate dehydrogenase